VRAPPVQPLNLPFATSPDFLAEIAQAEIPHTTVGNA
jgi:hypothetical protein